MFSKRILCQNWHVARHTLCPEGLKTSLLQESKYLKGVATSTRHGFRIKANNHLLTSKSSGIQPTPPLANIQGNYGGVVPFSNIRKAFVFTCAFSAGCYVGATIYEYEQVRSYVGRIISEQKASKFSNFKWNRNKNESRELEVHTQIQKEVSNWWNRLSPGEKVFAPLCALNIIVFGLWRIPRLQKTMMTYFCSNPAARVVCWPMFLSTFSHYSFFHIFANMYVLHSFSNAAVMSLGEQQFLGLYLSAGVISSLASYALKAATSTAGPSLGASGAIMAILAFVCVQYPDTQLSILFLPTFTFSAGVAIKAIMGLDLAGCLLGWKFFDHAAHLGGAVFGMFWALYGKEVLWPKRHIIQKQYHTLRHPVDGRK